MKNQEDEFSIMAARKAEENVSAAKEKKRACQKTLGEIIKRKRKHLGMTQRELNTWLKRNNTNLFAQRLEKPWRGQSYSVETLIYAIRLLDGQHE